MTMTFDLRNSTVTFIDGDTYSLDVVSPSILTWHDGDKIIYTFNRDTVTGESNSETSPVLRTICLFAM